MKRDLLLEGGGNFLKDYFKEYFEKYNLKFNKGMKVKKQKFLYHL